MIILVNNLTDQRLAQLFLLFVLIGATGVGLLPLDQTLIYLVSSFHIIVLEYIQIHHLCILSSEIKFAWFYFMMA